MSGSDTDLGPLRRWRTSTTEASPDSAHHIADSQREGAKSVAAGDQPGPVRMVERRRCRMRRHEICQRGSVISKTVTPPMRSSPGGTNRSSEPRIEQSFTGATDRVPPLPDVAVIISVRVAHDRQSERIVRVDDIHAA